jgi:hypothetical protein
MSDWQEERRRRGRARRDEVIRLPVLRVRRHGVIDGHDGDVLICASVGPPGEVVAVWTTPQDREAVTSATVSAGGASFPDPGAARPVAARITVHTPDLAAVTQIQDLALAHVTVQPMPGDRFLLVGARCRWQPEGPGPQCGALRRGRAGRLGACARRRHRARAGHPYRRGLGRVLRRGYLRELRLGTE